MVVLTDFRVLLEILFDVSLVKEHPPEECLLDLLIILLFEEVVMEKLHGSNYNQFTPPRAHVKCRNGSVGGETDGASGENGETGLPDVDGGSEGVDELDASVLVSVGQLVLGVAVLLGVLASLFFLLV